MQKVDWLVYADDEASEVRLRRRTRDATEHLHLLAERVGEQGLHLVLDPSTELCFSLLARDLPWDVIDRRFEGDALATALADRRSVLVVGGGPFLGQPASLDPRWQLLGELDRSRATLVCSPLSGRYYGLFVDGPLAIRYEPEDG